MNQNNLNEALADDITHFLKKTWAYAINSVEPARKTIAAVSGYRELNKLVTAYIRNFTQIMNQQNKNWSNLTWSNLYNFLTKSISFDDNNISDSDLIDILKNPIMRKVETRVGMLYPINLSQMRKRTPISQKPYNSKIRRYAAQDISEALIGLACERLVANSHGWEDDTSTPVSPEQQKSEVEEFVKAWNKHFASALNPQAREQLANDLIDFVSDHHDPQSRQILAPSVRLTSRDPQISPQIKSKLKSSLKLTETQFKTISSLLESIGVQWKQTRWQPMLEESTGSIIIKRRK